MKALKGFKAFYFSVRFRFGFGVYVKWPLLNLLVAFAEIRPPKPKKIKSKSCTFSVWRSVSVSAHM